LPASPGEPYLTVSLDWTPNFEDPGRRPPDEWRPSEKRNLPAHAATIRRPALTWFEKHARALIENHEPHSPLRNQLEADVARVVAYLESELDPSARGVYIVSSQSRDLFLPLALGVTVPTRIDFGSLPRITPIAHIAEDYATYAILSCDQHEAELSFVTQGTRDQGISLESTLFPRKQAQGGWSQRRYQARADERVAHFARAVSEEVGKALRKVSVDVIVLAGSKVFMDALMSEFPPEIRNRVAGTVPMNRKATPSAAALIDATTEIATRAEQQREASAVASVQDLLGSGRAVAGAADVLNALQTRQVMTLVMNEDMHGTGWTDPGFPLYGVGPIPDEHPAGGDTADLLDIDLVEEFIRLTLQNDGEIELVHVGSTAVDQSHSTATAGNSTNNRSSAAQALDDLGGVAALLRYAE
jgi:hypoxanthine-guanine phosphoribosyltransferase